MALRHLLAEALTELNTTPPLAPGKMLRASGFAEVCPREEVLVAASGLVRTRTRNADNLLTLALGHGIHYAVQNHVLPKIGALYGVWRCLLCAHLEGMPPEPEPFRVEAGVRATPLDTFLVLRPVRCPKCGSVAERCVQCAGAENPCGRCQEKQWLYKELHFEAPEHGIGGHPDGYLRIPSRPDLGLLEIKSTSLPFEVRLAPLVAHAIQVQIYLWFTGLRWAKVLYWSKGDWGMKALIEHTIERDEETIAAIQAALVGLWAGLEPGGPLPRRICASVESVRAKGCNRAGPCFQAPDAPEADPEPETISEAAAGECF